MPRKQQRGHLSFASVKDIGVTEVRTGLVLVGSVLTIIFGHDWGISANAVNEAPRIIEVVTTTLALARALKHVGISHANAKVLAAHAPATARPLPPISVGRHEQPAAGDVGVGLEVLQL